MNIKQALAQAQQALNAIENNNLDSLLLLCRTLDFSKEKVIFNPEINLTPAEEKIFFDLVTRRANHEPIAQILGQKEFYGLDFFVDKNTLIPRPDSETLIELALEKFPDKNKKLKILEIGAGSGCLIITLLKLYNNSEAIAVDISPAALEITKKNAKLHKVENRLRPLLSDLFKEIKNEKFDLIISNPPYIPTADIKNLQKEVKTFEPITALDGGIDGLNFYRLIAQDAGNFLEKNAMIILEIGCDQEKEIFEIFTKNNFSFISQKPDLSGIIRILSFKNVS